MVSYSGLLLVNILYENFFFQTYYTEINFYHPDQVDTLDDVDTDDDVDTELDVDTQKYNNTILFYFC